jgi:hypothetical protein
LNSELSPNDISTIFEFEAWGDLLPEEQVSSEYRYPISRGSQPFGFVGEITGFIADLINPISGIAIQLLSL